MMIRVTEIAFVGYAVTDLPRARAFYEDVLNLRQTLCYEAGGKHWIEYDIGPGTLAISNMFPSWAPSAAGGSATLEVENFDEAVAALRASGVPFSAGPMTTPGCHLAIIQDPDGNSIGIHHRLPR